MEPIWINKKKSYPAVEKDLECDVCIVGGGLSGVLTAYLLQEHFEHIILIEADSLGFGASGRNTGKATIQHGFLYQELINKHGLKFAKMYYEMNQKALEEYPFIMKQKDIECDYEIKDAVVGCLSVENTKIVADEMKAYDQIGIEYSVVKEDEVKDIRYGARITKQASLNSYAFLCQLAAKLKVDIYEQSAMSELFDDYLITNQHKIAFKHCIIATQMLPFQFKPYYAVTQPLQSYLAVVESNHSKDMVYTKEKMTLTQNSFADFMLVGGYEHALSADCEKLWQDFNHFLEQNYQKIANKWSSQDLKTFDGLPIVGKSGAWYVMSGYNKWGITNALACAHVMVDCLLGCDSEYLAMLSPKRMSLWANTDFISENFKVMTSLISSKTLKQQPLDLIEGQAEITLIDKHPYGIYRQQEDLYVVDIVCPHLGCTLKFNQIDKTWDCPCHGSRFNIEGEIVKGPSLKPLEFTKLKYSDIAKHL